MRIIVLICIFLTLFDQTGLGQEKSVQGGQISGNILSRENNKPLNGATISLRLYQDTLFSTTSLSNESGEFLFTGIATGWYRLFITNTGYATYQIDSIHVRPEKTIFQLADIILSPQASGMETIVIFAEKPLIENKDGNIIFNATESPLSAGSNAAELLKNIPLVSNDPDGKITVRGREPKILIDDKPVEMNAQQLQDFLESMPGNMIEKIEVMTNPPPQFANEPGGVINIITRKGKLGISGRISVSAGTRGEGSLNGSISFRKKGLAIQFNAGTGFNQFQGYGNSIRQNIYPDSTNQLFTRNEYTNETIRPNARLNIDYDLNPKNSFNLTAQINQNRYDNRNDIEYANENRFGEIYKSSTRSVIANGQNISPSVNFSYTLKTKIKGEQLRLISGFNLSELDAERDFYQQFFDGKQNPTGQDSTQHQTEATGNRGMQLRLNYDRPLANNNTIFSGGAAYLLNTSHVIINSYSVDTPNAGFEIIPLLSNDFIFRQDIQSYRISMKQKLAEKFWLTGGVSFEATKIFFDLIRLNQEAGNDYANWLPFANLNKTWENKTNISLIYRRTIRRPGIRELNPAIDYSDPYNLRFGNPFLLPSMAHTFDLLAGKTADQFFINGGFGYNKVEDIFAVVRTLVENGVTLITWENISGRQEYEANAWMGYTFSKKLRLNMNGGYTYNKYSRYDIEVNKYQNGGSVNGRLNLSYMPNDLWNFTGNFNVNRFANPQGSVRSTVNMQFGLQHKLLQKRLVLNIHIIDPFVQQEYQTFTEGTNFSVESYSFTQTRNYRFTISYNFSNTRKKKQAAILPFS